MGRSIIFGLGTGAAAAILAFPVQSETPHWSRMAEEDLLAARALLIENHPAAAAEIGDTKFQEQLRSGYEEALNLAEQARSFGAYRAALQRFAGSFSDPHIATAPLVQADRQWPGFVVGLEDGHWKVIARSVDDTPPEEAILLSCDGRSPDDLAQERLAPFSGSWSVTAERVKMSTWLLQEIGNPHQPRLRSCEFSDDNGSRTYQLHWRPIGAVEIDRRIGAARPSPTREVSLEPFGGGYWIRLGTSGGSAVPLLAQAQQQEAAIRASPFVVLDLRGNDGGASYVTDELAKRIFGEVRVEEARRPAGTRQPEAIVWRASLSSLKTLEGYIERLSHFLPAQHPQMLGLIAQRDAVRQSLTNGAQTARAPAEVAQKPVAARQRRAPRPPRVILLTDGHCFSSCLQGVRLFRALGAEHVGKETRANTRYSDLRTIELPSGLSNFSTMQSFSTWLPMKLGPYIPSRQFDGDMVTDAVVKAWVREMVGRLAPIRKPRLKT